MIAALDAKLAEVGWAYLSNDQVADAILNLAPVEGWAISKDGPHEISATRKWLARQLLDSMLDEAEALGIVAYAPAIADAAAAGPLKLSPQAQFDIATRLAANVGYELTPEPEHPDSPHARRPEGPDA